MEGVKIARIEVDGFDATEKLGEIFGEWEFQAVFVAGVSFAGFNVIN